MNVAGLLARFEVTCRQLGIVDKEVTAPLYVWTTNCPSTGSYVIVDDINAFENVASTGLSYVVNPDVLVFMQEAPVIRYGTTALSEVISFTSGYNTNVSLSATGLTVYGAVGSGLGTYRAYPTGIDEDTFEARQNFGASSINGIQGNVWLDGTYPMRASAACTTCETIYRLKYETENLKQWINTLRDVNLMVANDVYNNSVALATRRITGATTWYGHNKTEDLFVYSAVLKNNIKIVPGTYIVVNVGIKIGD